MKFGTCWDKIIMLIVTNDKILIGKETSHNKNKCNEKGCDKVMPNISKLHKSYTIET